MENSNKYPNLKNAFFLIVAHEVMGILPYIVIIIIAKIFNIERSHPILNGVWKISALCLILLYLRSEKKLLIPRDTFCIKKYYPLRTFIIAITTLGLIMLINEIDKSVLRNFSMSKEMEESLRSLFSGSVSMWGTAISVIIIAPITEEILYRGIILRGFLSNYSPVKAILASALIFGMIHLNIWQGVGAFFIGLFIGWIYYKTKSLLWCIFIHMLNNGVAIGINFSILKTGNGNLINWINQSQAIWAIIGLVIFGLGVFWINRSFLGELNWEGKEVMRGER